MRKFSPELLRYRVQSVAGQDQLIDGTYLIPHYSVNGVFFMVVVSTGVGWDHVSVTLKNRLSQTELGQVSRCPTWEEMVAIKKIFFLPEEMAVEYHPPVKDNVSHHDYCLHLWRNQLHDFPAPPSLLVGGGASGAQRERVDMEGIAFALKFMLPPTALYVSLVLDKGEGQVISNAKDSDQLDQLLRMMLPEKKAENT